MEATSGSDCFFFSFSFDFLFPCCFYFCQFDRATPTTSTLYFSFSLLFYLRLCTPLLGTIYE